MQHCRARRHGTANRAPHDFQPLPWTCYVYLAVTKAVDLLRTPDMLRIAVLPLQSNITCAC